MRQLTYFLIGIFLLFSQGCSNPRNIQITEENKSTLFGELRASRALTPEEDQLLTGYRIRYEMAVAINEYEIRENNLPLVGKTVGELIDLQKQWLEEQKKTEEEATVIVPEAKVQEKAAVPEPKKAVTVTVIDKGYSVSSYQSGYIEDYLTYKIAYRNICNKDIRAFQGHLVFQDLSGRKIMSIGLKISRPIRAGKKAEEDKTLKFDPKSEEQKRFKNTALRKMKIVWIPEKITFTDGTAVSKG